MSSRAGIIEVFASDGSTAGAGFGPVLTGNSLVAGNFSRSDARVLGTISVAPVMVGSGADATSSKKTVSLEPPDLGFAAAAGGDGSKENVSWALFGARFADADVLRGRRFGLLAFAALSTFRVCNLSRISAALPLGA